MISLARARSTLDSYEVGSALSSILELRATYCPAEPATSSMDIALRAAGIPPHGMELNPVEKYIESSALQLIY
jgi:hypothetical protein